MSNIKERDFQKQVIDWLNRHNYKHLKTNTGLFYKKMGDKFIPFSTGNTGIADIIVFVEGFTIFLELKTDIGTLRPEQKEFKEWCKNNGFLHVVLKPKYWEWFKEEYKSEFKTIEGLKINNIYSPLYNVFSALEELIRIEEKKYKYEIKEAKKPYLIIKEFSTKKEVKDFMKNKDKNDYKLYSTLPFYEKKESELIDWNEF